MDAESGHIDSFARDRLPPETAWPVFNTARDDYADWLNAAAELTDRQVDRGYGDRVALIGSDEALTYADLAGRSARIAQALAEDFGVVPGNRVLILGPNTPALVACWLAVTRAGGIAVNTMAMLRASELQVVIDKAEIALAVCDSRSLAALESCSGAKTELRVVGYDGTAGRDGPLDRAAALKDGRLPAARTHRDDVALIAFTSGSTGAPKATMHFHRDLLAIADGYAKDVLGIGPDDICIGSPPLAFTFGLGALAIFPLRFGGAAVLYEKAGPDVLADLIARHRATLVFTAPTAYRAMLDSADPAQLASLRLAISAGETLPAPIFERWVERTGVPILDGIGATEMLHIFVSNRPEEAAPGLTGRPVAGYEARIFDDEMRALPPGEVGRLGVRGPTGCRYLDDPRQADYVRDGWNLTGDTFVEEPDGRFRFVARSDDMIVSAGYNIAGPEVESALLSHADVQECAVVAAPDAERGHIVEAHVVLRAGIEPTPERAVSLQKHVKNRIAPFKYPRRVVFTDSLPKTPTGKILRYRLRKTGAP